MNICPGCDCRPFGVQRVRVIAAHAWERLIVGPMFRLLAYFQLRLWGCRADAGLVVSGRLRIRNLGQLRIGRNVRINSGRNNFVGIENRMSIWVGRNAIVEIGDRCGLSNSTICCANNVRILADTFIGGGCRIYDTDFHQIEADARIANQGPVATGPIVIGPKAFVGAHCIILKGVTIGEGAVIGAGSVVTRAVPAHEIWAGVPAKYIKKIQASNDLTDGNAS